MNDNKRKVWYQRLEDGRYECHYSAGHRGADRKSIITTFDVSELTEEHRELLFVSSLKLFRKVQIGERVDAGETRFDIKLTDADFKRTRTAKTHGMTKDEFGKMDGDAQQAHIEQLIAMMDVQADADVAVDDNV